MFKVKFDDYHAKTILNNSIDYSEGFLQGIELNKIIFNEKFALFIEDALKKYIDSKARMNPKQLHHVYEWGQVGSPSARLFDFSAKITKQIIVITGTFLQSSSIPAQGTEPFIDKANIMENKISVVVSPKNSRVLVFEDDGETVFTPNSVYIDSPGGDEVAGAFGKCFEEFFEQYLTSGLLINSGILQDLSIPREFEHSFSEGVKVGKNAGIKAGKKYMDLPDGLAIK